MLSAIRSRITYVNVVATLVLVFAMTGGALAAKKYLITSTKQISPSVLKSLQGKSGPAGAGGVAGAQGPAGPAGPAGPGGGKGDTGVAGKEGAQGKEGPQGKQGATGAAGAKGAQGEPWTVGGKLPPEKTETGMWGGSLPLESGSEPFIPVSFTLPVEPAPTLVFVKKGEDQSAEGCPGVVGGLPKAKPGKLCVYEAFGSGEFSFSFGLK